jgi:HNH endonuclease
MAQWVHRLSDVDPTTRTGLCSECGTTPVKVINFADGAQSFRCMKSYKKYKTPWKKFKKDTCEHCGFVPTHPSQLDVDHIDGNNKNNDITNLMTLCANCHRLKTAIYKDWNNKKAPTADGDEG